MEYQKPGAKKTPTRKPAYKKPVEPDPVFIATGSFIYRFKDGTYLRLREGVAVLGVEPGHMKELKKHGHVREVR